MRVVFFGLGAVSSVMATLFDELSNKSENSFVDFLFIVRDKRRAKKHLFKNSKLLNRSDFLEVSNFEDIFSNPEKYKKELKNFDIFINSSTPSYNLNIMKLAIEFNTNYADLASDIYKNEVINSLKFEQQSLEDELKSKNLFALINLGISPGITNFLIGEKIDSLSSLPHNIKITKIEINLLEEIQSKKLIFSWSPKVAIDELTFSPIFFKNNKIKQLAPFAKSKPYKFPYFRNIVDVYPVFQEELISLKQSFPNIKNIRLNIGGNELELMKSLYQLNLFSNTYCFEDKEEKISINKIIKNIIPKMKSPEVIEDYIKKKTIKYAEFSAIADIYLEIKTKDDKKIKSIESIGLSFSKYTELINSPFSGSTYISYATGVAAGILIFYSLLNKKYLKGVVLSENLPKIFGGFTNDIIKRELNNYKINLISQIK
ncbi:MAG: saccharopine dehydrogenase C-terminal domain-containing protein [Aliarcobacter skirrowii]|uniref:saccharopine dehydrogenase C-terminal domain-containing protein n=1 Tax=Aliarcobacter skirrowii TaxID=28200 RepID=UPI00242C6789|nr:saccharopine dehydrogenase C-terminal domain-containing protein [Aliarcobacter skirrowii]MDD2507439.1 saccharopine dehydrogenase C-terminal domain-containing protein [Aliarcobacter skirrowii]MDD3495791.1 saccharopine dehydrogenase C-terminal domain-containing protein [Aliarcobacter skirrowii]